MSFISALIKSPTSVSLSASIKSESSLSELNVVSAVQCFQISRYKKSNFPNFYIIIQCNNLFKY